jgi:transcription-repair coupling factor (superfamily II helicase)
VNRLQEYVVGELARCKEFKEGISALLAHNNISISRLPGSALSLFIAAIAKRLSRPICLITSHAERAEQIYDDLDFFGLGDVFHFAEDENLPYEFDEPSIEILAKQIETYAHLAEATTPPGGAAPGVIIASLESMFRKSVTLKTLNEHTVSLHQNESIDTEELARRLHNAGYVRVPIVETRGEFAVRGGIVDIFPLNSDLPVRLDLFGNQIEAIRHFDPSTQRSLKKEPVQIAEAGSPFHRPITFPPAKKNLLILRALEQGEPLVPLPSLLPSDTLFVLDEPEKFPARAKEFWDLIQRQHAERRKTGCQPVPCLEHGQSFEKTDCQPVVRPEGKGDGTGYQPILRRDNPELLFESLDSLERQIRARAPLVEHHLIEVAGQSRPNWTNVVFHAGVFDGLQPHLETFLGIVREQMERDHLVVIACDNDGQVQRFDELLRERLLDCLAIPSSDRQARAFHQPSALSPQPSAVSSQQSAASSQPSALSDQQPDITKQQSKIENRKSKIENLKSKIVLTVGPLSGGFVLPEARLLFLTDREVFGRYKHRHLYRKLYRGTPLGSIADIQRGDYVVHVDHGIGQFMGLRRQKLDGRESDLIEILYQDNDRLLVPVEKIQFVQKYSAVEGAVPSLDKLGGKRWIQRKRKSQEAIEKMAEELLDLYARRAAAKGHDYGPDTVWQSEFEASFLYQETPDQLRAIDEVKDDLQRPIPMDRLVCGDVGYGKTEVAMRAAFKIVQEHRQVAVLVPTTILAQQHLATFSERFADYDVRIAMLSRFKTPREQREILRRLRLGELDIIIGTHRLLSKDVEFADLGLVVVDEEHRFGVRHKEKLKQMRTSVDVLTLTATPIPRTLHMALSGLRDMSVINTPPADRVPIRTNLIHFEHELIEEAVLRELNRGGQVFFVHNRVHNIDPVARRLREIVPQASLAVAHGQMDEHTLERVMLDFVNGKYDILVSTTIIESGLDIPNVNTIIVNRADALGLAQLYQLRGRVGRSARQAYAYLVVPHGEAITDAAVRRLAAIQEFVELGAGFQIAMRDMEIRGTGNILGREQHGAMIAIGFELYCDLLQKAVHKLKGEETVAEITAEIKWPIDAYLPETYVPLEAQRVGLYKRLAQVRTLRAIRDIEEEVRDRYGRPPDPAEALIEMAALRVGASLCAIHRVSGMPNGVRLEVAGDARAFLRRLELARHHRASIQAIRLDSSEAIEVTIKPPSSRPLSKLHEAVALMEQLAELR